MERVAGIQDRGVNGWSWANAGIRVAREQETQGWPERMLVAGVSLRYSGREQGLAQPLGRLLNEIRSHTVMVLLVVRAHRDQDSGLSPKGLLYPPVTPGRTLDRAGSRPCPWLFEGGLQLLKGRFSLLHFLSLLLPFLLFGFDLFLKSAGHIDGLYLRVRMTDQGCGLCISLGSWFPRVPF